MGIALTEEQRESIVIEQMVDSIDTINDLLAANYDYHYCNLGKPFAPMYSYDVFEENKKLTKMKKAFIRVHDWYSLVKYKDKK
jgi:hypothetical protein